MAGGARILLEGLQAAHQRGDGAEAERGHRRARPVPRTLSLPAKADGSDPRLCPNCGNGQLALRGGKFGAFVACSNYPECKFTRRFGQPGGEGGEDSGPEVLGQDPETGLNVERKSGRFGPYIQLGEGKEAARASIPKDFDLDLEWALKLLSLPRTIGNHPETGNPITASIGRYGPYLAHDGKYARLQSTAEVFETGMNAAVVKLAEAAANGGRPARGASREPLKILGKHPRTEAEIKLMEGRYGAYVTDGETNATLPKSVDKDQLTLEEAAQLIDARAAAGPPRARARKRPRRRRRRRPKRQRRRSNRHPGESRDPRRQSGRPHLQPAQPCARRLLRLDDLARGHVLGDLGAAFLRALATRDSGDVEPFVRLDEIDVDPLGAARIDDTQIETGLCVAARGIVQTTFDEETCALETVAHCCPPHCLSQRLQGLAGKRKTKG
jgi:topoisomerase IA-like protein